MLGDQRARIVDFNPATGKTTLCGCSRSHRAWEKAAFATCIQIQPWAQCSILQRIQHGSRRRWCHVIYGTLNLIFSSILDKDLYDRPVSRLQHMADDCRGYDNRLKPIGVLPLQDVDAAVVVHRCVNELGMIGVAVAPDICHSASESAWCFPDIRSCKTISHPTFLDSQAAVDLDIGLGIHGGQVLIWWVAFLTETFVLTHIFVQRNQQQLAMARMVFDGIWAIPHCGRILRRWLWLGSWSSTPSEHWENASATLTKHPYRPSLMEFTNWWSRKRDSRQFQLD